MTDKINDGGPAYPCARMSSDGERIVWDETGMSLRDWFAGQALTNMQIGNQPVDIAWFEQHGAKHVYAIADAMLAAREKRHD